MRPQVVHTQQLAGDRVRTLARGIACEGSRALFTPCQEAHSQGRTSAQDAVQAPAEGARNECGGPEGRVEADEGVLGEAEEIAAGRCVGTDHHYVLCRERLVDRWPIFSDMDNSNRPPEIRIGSLRGQWPPSTTKRQSAAPLHPDAPSVSEQPNDLPRSDRVRPSSRRLENAVPTRPWSHPNVGPIGALPSERYAPP